MTTEKNKGLGKYPNAVWTTIVTMTTVGYGDIYPQTPLGKVIAIMIALFGALLTALFVVTVERMLVYEVPELKAYELLEKIMKKEELREAAIVALQRVFQLERAEGKKKLKLKKKIRGDFLSMHNISRPIIYDQCEQITDHDFHMKELRELRKMSMETGEMIKQIMDQNELQPKRKPGRRQVVMTKRAISKMKKKMMEEKEDRQTRDRTMNGRDPLATHLNEGGEQELF